MGIIENTVKPACCYAVSGKISLIMANEVKDIKLFLSEDKAKEYVKEKADEIVVKLFKDIIEETKNYKLEKQMKILASFLKSYEYICSHETIEKVWDIPFVDYDEYWHDIYYCFDDPEKETLIGRAVDYDIPVITKVNFEDN